MPLLTSLMKIVQTHLQHTSLGAYRFIVELERDLWRTGEGAMATLQAGHHENSNQIQMQPQGTQLQTAKIPGLPCSQLEGVLVTSIALIFNLA